MLLVFTMCAASAFLSCPSGDIASYLNPLPVYEMTA